MQTTAGNQALSLHLDLKIPKITKTRDSGFSHVEHSNLYIYIINPPVTGRLKKPPLMVLPTLNQPTKVQKGGRGKVQHNLFCPACLI